MDSRLLEGQSQSTPWVCRHCGTENPGYVLECAGCAHEPVLGRRDFEYQKWAEAHRYEDEA